MSKQTSVVLLFILLLVIALVSLFFILGQEEKPPQSTTPPENRVEAATAKLLVDALDDSPASFSIVREDDFTIRFNKRAEFFQITIIFYPFEEGRQKAEQAFLELLDSDEASACALDVQISTPLFANPMFAGQIFPLSFCQ